MSSKKPGVSHDKEKAIVLTKIDPCGEIDFEFIQREKENKKKKIMEDLE